MRISAELIFVGPPELVLLSDVAGDSGDSDLPIATGRSYTDSHMLTASHNPTLSRSPTSSLRGIKLVANVVWYRSKAKLKGALSRRGPDTTRASSQRRGFPPEIVEMIIARLEYDILALKACAATSFSWYNIAFPLIHHTFIFRDRSKTTSRACLNPLFPMHKLGLLPFVKKAQFHKEDYAPHWVVPAIFDPQSMRYFRALVNLQDLAIEALDLSLFPPEPVGAFFGHFSPTLRSLALMCPLGSRRRLLDFFRLFPKLDDIMICEYFGEGEDHEVLDGKLIPIEGGLRGQLKLKNAGDEGLLKDMIVAFGGMRFTSVCLESVQWAVPLLLKACAGTLQTVYIYPGDGSHIVTPLLIDLSHCTVLRSLEIPSHSFPPLASNCAYMIRALSTITSPVFSEIVVVFENGGRWQGELADVLAEMYNVKQFRVRFCLQAPERSRADFLPRLASYTRAEIAEGTYDFLPCPPLIFSRPVSNFDHLYQNVQGWHAP